MSKIAGACILLLASILCADVVSAAQGPAQGPQAPVPDPLVRAENLTKVAAHTYVITDGNVPIVPNVGIIVGSKGTLVIDPGLGRRNGETVLREVQRLSPKNEIFIGSTHFHTEHTTGHIAFPESATYVGTPIQEQEYAEGGAQQAKNFSARSAVTADLLKDAVGPKLDVRFDREYVLDLGGVRVRMNVVGPTHTRGDTTFFVEEDRVLFAGDVVMNNSFVAANQNSSMKAWLIAFDRLEAMKPLRIVPAHGAMGDGLLIATNRGFMTSIQARARELKAQGRSADETATTVQKEMVTLHPDWARANGVAAAARSAYNEAP